MKLLLQLKSPLVNPGDGAQHSLVAGDFETADDENYVVATPFGKLAIPRGQVDYMLVVDEAVELSSLGALQAVHVLN